jgi:hypothetical protein
MSQGPKPLTQELLEAEQVRFARQTLASLTPAQRLSATEPWCPHCGEETGEYECFCQMDD